MAMEREITHFPPNFAWGTSASAYQTEGGNKNDWTVWEKQHQQPEDYNGQACDFYHRYPEDFKLASEELHTNSIRLSVEWSRVQPEKGMFDTGQLDQYERVLEVANKNGLSPMVTFHHFTNPTWFAEMGGWSKKDNISYFVDYVAKCRDRFDPLSRWYLTINEPIAYVGNSYLLGKWTPERKNPILAARVYRNMADAHRRSYSVLKESTTDKPISCAINMADIRGLKPFDRLARSLFNYSFLHLTQGTHDYIGLNYYQPQYLIANKASKSLERSDCGWPIDAKGMYNLTMQTWKRYHLPIMITENGLADAKDEKRAKFIVDHLRELGRAMHDGADVRGYFHWSLLDNFEWDLGYRMKFGLVAVDFNDPALPRKVRKSAYTYAEICKTFQLPVS